jgi:cytochrome c-type biogenesis protein CcmH
MTTSCDASTPYYKDFITVTESLRCPVCEGQRVSSSDAPFALTVKRDVCDYLRQGLTTSDTITRVEEAYGSDLHVENDTSIIMLPLVILLVTLCIIGTIMLKKMMAKV